MSKYNIINKIASSAMRKSPLKKHLQGNEALEMFKQYGGIKIPEGKYGDISKYVPEARIKYGLVGDQRISDQQIAESLYKQAKEISGTNSPLLLFRGDTQSYETLAIRPKPSELTSGSLDNSYGNLFLGEFPNEAQPGITRYLITQVDHPRRGTHVIPSATGANSSLGFGASLPNEYINKFGGYKLFTSSEGTNVYKFPSKFSESKVNDINLFIPRKPKVRNSTEEIAVLEDDWKRLEKDRNIKDRRKFIEEVLKDSKSKKQNVLKSNINSKYRADEHTENTYYAVPNHAINTLKHILPYDLRIPRNFKDKNIFRGIVVPTTLVTGYSLTNNGISKG